MIIVRRKGEILRLGLFLVLFGLMAYFIMSKAGSFQSSSAEVKTFGPPAPMANLVEDDPFLEAAKPDARDYFAGARLARDKNRSLRKHELQAAIDNPNIDEAVRKTMSQELQAVMKHASLEAQAEALIRGRGIEDVVVTFSDSGAEVSVRGENDERMARQLADSVARMAGLKLSAITVRFQK